MKAKNVIAVLCKKFKDFAASLTKLPLDLFR